MRGTKGRLALLAAGLGAAGLNACEGGDAPDGPPDGGVENDATDASSVLDVPSRPVDADGGARASDAEATSDTTVRVDVGAEDFGCILEGTKVRRFYVRNLLGRLDEALAVAESDDGGRYPPGTVLQLVPFEAMVKRGPGWNPPTNDWEFFSLEASEEGTSVLERGTEEVENQFGGNCVDCHAKAEPKWDFVCEQDHGCDPLPLSADQIESVQEGDPRCP